MRRPQLDEDDGAGAGQDLFATALIAMILLTASFLLNVGPQNVEESVELPDDYRQDVFAIIDDGGKRVLKVFKGGCVTAKPEEFSSVKYIFKPEGLSPIPRIVDPRFSPLCLCIVETVLQWEESC
ncbi:hypothetical protein [Vibrio alfacsensis]|uniref:hypothetical protein n=1 Tax=Vibrio alfacsensis TaxID=1074311 RepID=UPI00406839C3